MAVSNGDDAARSSANSASARARGDGFGDTNPGRTHEADLGGCWRYVKSYADANKKQPIQAAMSVLSRLCKAVALILETADELTAKRESEAA